MKYLHPYNPRCSGFLLPFPNACSFHWGLSVLPAVPSPALFFCLMDPAAALHGPLRASLLSPPGICEPSCPLPASYAPCIVGVPAHWESVSTWLRTAGEKHMVGSSGWRNPNLHPHPGISAALCLFSAAFVPHSGAFTFRTPHPHLCSADGLATFFTGQPFLSFLSSNLFLFSAFFLNVACSLLSLKTADIHIPHSNPSSALSTSLSSSFPFILQRALLRLLPLHHPSEAPLAKVTYGHFVTDSDELCLVPPLISLLSWALVSTSF